MPYCGWRIREEISSSPLVSGNIQTAADVRCRTRAPSDIRIDDARRTINLFLFSFVRIGEPREIRSTRENWPTIVTSQSIHSECRRTEHDAIRAAAHLHD